MVRTGGTLSAKMIELIGDLNEQKTMSNITRAINNIEKKLGDKNNKLKLNVELFARVEDMRRDISEIQSKIKNTSSIKDIKLGVSLDDITIKDINEQVAKAQQRFNEGKSSSSLKMNIDFDFKGSASKIKEEMDGIKQFMQRYGEQMKNMDIVNLDSDAQNVARNADSIKKSVGGLDRGVSGVGESIEGQMRKITQSTGAFSVNFKQDVNGAIQGATSTIKDADGTVNKFTYSLNENSGKLELQARSTKTASDQAERLAKVIADTDQAQRQLNKVLENAPKGFDKDLAKQAQGHIDVAREMAKQGKVTNEGVKALDMFKNEMKNVNREVDGLKADQAFDKMKKSTQEAISELAKLDGSAEKVRHFEKSMNEMSRGSVKEMKALGDSVKQATQESVRDLQQMESAFEKVNRQSFENAIKDGDINAIKRYVEEMKGASVASLRLSDAKDKEGNAISRVKVNMEAQNGAIKSSTIEYDKATGKVYELDKSTKTLSESNKGLDGSFAGILSRITQYFSAMQILQKGMQAIKKTISEILQIDAQMIELARVADPSLNLDVMLQRSVELSKELGASVYDVVGVVGDMARTFGEFNEEQILAIARTATIMQNVSELSLEQASETLVGTMKAFNIEAEDSIRIVNSFNEVDNNFAISTDQISNAMARAGATATTFGIEMEELVGDVTAIGEVTQESGERIGTALRTIYSRVTTHKDSIEILEGLGIALREMGDAGPEVRDVSDILGELGEMWNDLSKAQQQNIGLAMAGRNRLTQFLALMNNQATAVEATTTAYNSQGSAMREQREYMKSYEYQMTVLGATATDVALTIEDKFVGDAMYLVVSAGTSMLETLDNLIERFGFLPVVLGGVSTAVLLLSKTVRGFALDRIPEIVGGLITSGVTLTGVVAKLGTAIAGLFSAGALMKLLTGGVVVGGIMAIGWAIEKLVSKIVDVKKANEEAKYAMDEAITAYNTQGNEINSLIDRYEELHNAQKKGELEPEAEREYLDLINQISTMLPNAISHIDSQGQAHLKSADAIREQSGAMEDLARANAHSLKDANEESLAELIEDIADAQERQTKASDEAEASYSRSQVSYADYKANIDALNQSSYAHTVAMSEEAYERNILSKATEEYYEKSSLASANAFEMSQKIQETNLIIGDQTVAMMTADGSMKNVSTTAQALIRDYASMNSQVLENAEGEEELAEAREKLTEDSEKFGEIMVGVYDDIADGLNEIDAEKAIDQFDQLISALPEEEFTKSFDVIEQNMDSLQSIIGDVATGAEIDIEKLVSMLESAGMESDTARSYVIALGEAFENQQIRSAVAEETLTEYNDELVRTKEVALEAFNPLEALFGFESDSLKGMESHLSLLRLMKNQYGETWSEMDRGQPSIQALADYFDTSTDIVVENFDLLEEVTRGLSTTKYEYSEDAKKEVLVFDETISGTARNFINKMLEMGDEFPGFTDTLVAEMGILEVSQEEMAKKTEEVNERFKKLFEAPEDVDAKNLFLETIRTDLEELRGSITYTEDDVEGLKLVMADGSKSVYLDNLNEQLKESKMALHVDKDDEGNILVFIENEATGAIDKIGSLNDLAVDGRLALDLQKEAMRGLISEATSEEDKKTFVSVLQTQMEAFGEEIVIAGNKTDGFKLQMEGQEDNPWLVALNSLVEELGIKIDQTKDDAGNLEIAFQTKDGETFFTTAKGEVEELDEKIKETGKSADELANPDEERTVDIDYDDSKVKEGLVETEYDIDVVTGGGYYIMMDGDNTGVHESVDDANKKADELEDKSMKFEVDADSLKDLNSVRKEIYDTQLEIVDLQSALENIKKDLSVTNADMQSLMTNTKNINNAHSAIKNLIEVIDVAVGKMGDLYQMFSSDAGIDTSGIENSAKKIADEAHSIERALVSIQGYVTGMNLSLRNMDASFDITPITNYRVSILNNAQLIASDISALAVVVRTQMQNVSNAFQQGNVSLAQVQVITNNILGQVVILHRLTGEMITNYSLKASSDMLNNYNKGLVGILQATTTFKSLMDTHFKQFYTSIVNKVTMTAVDMRSKFTDGTNDIVRIAEGLPGRIGQGIRNNISQATSSMTALASSMVTRFKRELGIHSPSRVFTELGGHVIDGLVNGLTGSDITNLGQTVFSDFSDGAISTINEIKGYMTFEPVTAGSFGAGFTKTSGFGPRSSPGGIGSTNHKGVDYGAPRGTPIPSQSSGTVIASGYNGSMGNYVRVRSGDGKVHTYMHNSRNNVGVGQTIGRGQILGLVGSTGNSTGPHVHYQVDINGVPIDPEKRFRGFAEGGFVDKKELAWHGEEGLEAIIPLIPERRERGLDLWKQSGEILGMSSELIDMLIGTKRKSSEYGGSTGFAGMDGEAGEGSSASGTSGVMKPDTSSIMKAFGVEHEPMFTSMARDEKPEALYNRNIWLARTEYSDAIVKKANIELKALTEQTLEYRNALEMVSKKERQLKIDIADRLRAVKGRQSRVDKELATLSNTSKHTVAQRKRYNQLQEEFDKNTKAIMDMEDQIRELDIAMDARKLEIYTDYLGQLAQGYDRITDSIERTRAKSQFMLDKLTLTDENDISGQLSLQYDILKQTMDMELTLQNHQSKIKGEYDKAVKKYGRNSAQALEARKQLISVEDSYRSSVIDRIKKEKEIESTRRDVANNGIDALKDYYKQTQSMTEKAIDLERKALEKAHENKMSMYDDEISKIESVYDARLKEMDDEKAEEEFENTISELNKQRAQLMADVSRASRDTSLEGRKRLAELQSELSDVNSEISTTQKDRQEELYRKSIENQKQMQIDAVEAEREKVEKEQEIRIESLDKQLEDSKKYADKMVNDESMWKSLADAFVEGDTSPLNQMIEEMQMQMAKYASGDFYGISMGYGDLSREDKAEFQDDVLLDISNSILKSNDALEQYISTSNKEIENIKGQGTRYELGAETTGKAPSIKTSGYIEPKEKMPKPKPKPKPVQNNRYHTIRRGDTLWDLAQKFYGNPYKWTTIAQANKNPDPYRLQIGRRLLVPFKTGGYTGDWVGDEGRVAMLHKKELVLNESQTEDILNVAKIVESIAGIIPKMQVNRPKLSTSSSSSQGDTYMIDNLNLNMKDFKGSRDDAKRAFDNMAKELKKRGKK